MRYHHFQPAPQLSPYIECLWMIEASAASAVAQRARMPADSRATLLLSFAGETRLRAGEQTISEFGLGAHLLGAHSQSYVLEHDGDTQLIAVQFRPGGLASFVRYGAGELAERTTPLELLWGGAANRLCEQIHEAKTPAAKVALYQDTLLQRFAEVSHQPRVLHALARIEAAQGSLSVEGLAGEVGVLQQAGA